MRQETHGIRLILLLLYSLITVSLTSRVSASTTSSPFPIMQVALEQTLHLRFAQALETATTLEATQYPAFASPLTRGMIAYFQGRWQTRRSPAPPPTSHRLLQEVLEEGQKHLSSSPRDAQLLLFLGLAATFNALLQQENDFWHSFQLFAQGKTWLQQALVSDATTTDAHLGLGLLYFAGVDLPPWLRRLWERMGGLSTEAALHHLQQAVSGAHFTKDVARTFLAQAYTLERRYNDAIVLGETLQETFPENGYYTLLTGRSQCAQTHYEACAKTLETLAARHQTAGSPLAHRDDRLEMYYYLGLAYNETGRYDQAFETLRQAINEDPSNERDEGLWAKYYLAALYERRGQLITARQLYRTLLRGRNVEDLHRRVQQRLSHLPSP
jgi:tetratricopeptide (TPR) repeat protein